MCCGELASSKTGGPSHEEMGQVCRWSAMVIDVHDSDSDLPCKAAIACWECFWKIDPDYWISVRTWDAQEPSVSSGELPLFDHESSDGYDVSLYQS